jgi:hypothetical protein
MGYFIGSITVSISVMEHVEFFWISNRLYMGYFIGSIPVSISIMEHVEFFWILFGHVLPRAVSFKISYYKNWGRFKRFDCRLISVKYSAPGRNPLRSPLFKKRMINIEWK